MKELYAIVADNERKFHNDQENDNEIDGNAAATPAFLLTAEQQAIVDAVGAHKVVAAQAFAGTGKTSTGVAVARAYPEKKILVLCFNAENAREAKEKYPANSTILTTHGLAYRTLSRALQKRLVHQWSPSTLRLELPEFKAHPDPKLAYFVYSALHDFFQSSDEKIDTKIHGLNAMADAGSLGAAALVEQIARMFWAAMQSERPTADMRGNSNKIAIPHDAYLKQFALRGEFWGYDLIIFDEAQDANRVTLGMLETQLSSGSSLLYLGDKHQAIYDFRGAVNAMNCLPDGAITLPLTQSWRFGPGVARTANLLLSELKNEEKQIVGMGEDQEFDPAKPYTYLARTNVELINFAAKHVYDGAPPLLWVGGISQYRIDLLEDVYKLMRGQHAHINDEYIKKHFKTWAEFQAAARYDSSARILTNLIDKYGDNTPTLIDGIRANATDDPAEARYTLTTVHKSKGLEWPQVRIANDFADPLLTAESWLANASSKPFPEAEINLLYVYVTRAKSALMINDEMRAWLRDLPLYRKTRRRTLDSDKPAPRATDAPSVDADALAPGEISWAGDTARLARALRNRVARGWPAAHSDAHALAWASGAVISTAEQEEYWTAKAAETSPAELTLRQRLARRSLEKEVMPDPEIAAQGLSGLDDGLQQIWLRKPKLPPIDYTVFDKQKKDAQTRYNELLKTDPDDFSEHDKLLLIQQQFIKAYPRATQSEKDEITPEVLGWMWGNNKSIDWTQEVDAFTPATPFLRRFVVAESWKARLEDPRAISTWIKIDIERSFDRGTKFSAEKIEDGWYTESGEWVLGNDCTPSADEQKWIDEQLAGLEEEKSVRRFAWFALNSDQPRQLTQYEVDKKGKHIGSAISTCTAMNRPHYIEIRTVLLDGKYLQVAENGKPLATQNQAQKVSWIKIKGLIDAAARRKTRNTIAKKGAKQAGTDDPSNGAFPSDSAGCGIHIYVKTAVYSTEPGNLLTLAQERSKLIHAKRTYEIESKSSRAALKLLQELPDTWQHRLLQRHVGRILRTQTPESADKFAAFVLPIDQTLNDIERMGLSEGDGYQLKLMSSDSTISKLARLYADESALITHEILYNDNAIAAAIASRKKYIESVPACEREKPYITKQADKVERRARMREVTRKLLPLLEIVGKAPGRAQLEHPLEDFQPLVLRASDKAWWSRQLGSRHPRFVEKTASLLCLHDSDDRAWKAVTKTTVERMQQRDEFQRDMLKKQYLKNPDTGEITSKYDLIMSGPNAPAARYAERFFRMQGINEFALLDLGLMPVFNVLTLSSLWHRLSNHEPNKNWDPETDPKKGNSHLAELFNDFLRLLEHNGIQPFGYRTVEMHADWTPHWNVLMYIKKEDFKKYCELVRRKFLFEERRGEISENAYENGAAEHRVTISKVVPLDKEHRDAHGKPTVIPEPKEPSAEGMTPENYDAAMKQYEQDMQEYNEKLCGAVTAYMLKYTTKDLAKAKKADDTALEENAMLGLANEAGEVEIIQSQDSYALRVHGLRSFETFGETLSISCFRALRSLNKKELAKPEFIESWNEPTLRALAAAIGAEVTKKDGKLDLARDSSGLKIGRANFREYFRLTEWNWRGQYKHGDIVSLEVFTREKLAKVEDGLIYARGIPAWTITGAGEKAGWRETAPREGEILTDYPPEGGDRKEQNAYGEAAPGKEIFILGNINMPPFRQTGNTEPRAPRPIKIKPAKPKYHTEKLQEIEALKDQAQQIQARVKRLERQLTGGLTAAEFRRRLADGLAQLRDSAVVTMLAQAKDELAAKRAEIADAKKSLQTETLGVAAEQNRDVDTEDDEITEPDDTLFFGAGDALARGDGAAVEAYIQHVKNECNPIAAHALQSRLDAQIARDKKRIKREEKQISEAHSEAKKMERARARESMLAADVLAREARRTRSKSIIAELLCDIERDERDAEIKMWAQVQRDAISASLAHIKTQMSRMREDAEAQARIAKRWLMKVARLQEGLIIKLNPLDWTACTRDGIDIPDDDAGPIIRSGDIERAFSPAKITPQPKTLADLFIDSTKLAGSAGKNQKLPAFVPRPLQRAGKNLSPPA